MKTDVLHDLQNKMGIKNSMEIPHLEKIVVSMGLKDALLDKKNLEWGSAVLTQITGQKPKITKAKKSISTFKLREGEEIGIMVTLRGKRMYDFFEKLIHIALPRVRDFRGIKRTSFDGHGNYSLGFNECTVFPEIDPGKIEKIQGVQITIVTSAKLNKDAEMLLETLGMPFEKQKTVRMKA